MEVIDAAAVEIRRFVDLHQTGDELNRVSTLDELKQVLRQADSPLEAALIPLEQATRTPKILVDSGETTAGIAWRTLQCPGGPLVLQMICDKVNFALWVQGC
ncbi:MAG: Uncharacterised protein [Synechococcus sp. CC9902]|nr:MAG: Uncharacterised protein [Synechococcus sp. CC9902]|tara:strand:+ start:1310 stop:1615 length:306 start_codon:yes stop_codon:yes gene_type:complete